MFLFLLLLGGAIAQFAGGGACEDFLNNVALATDLVGVLTDIDLSSPTYTPSNVNSRPQLTDAFQSWEGQVRAFMGDTYHVFRVGATNEIDISTVSFAPAAGVKVAFIGGTVRVQSISNDDDIVLCGDVQVTGATLTASGGAIEVESVGASGLTLSGTYSGDSLSLIATTFANGLSGAVLEANDAAGTGITLTSGGDINIARTTFNSAAGISVITTGGFVSTGALTAAAGATTTLTATTTVTVGGNVDIGTAAISGTTVTIGSSGTPVDVLIDGGTVTASTGSIVIVSDDSTGTINLGAATLTASTAATGCIDLTGSSITAVASSLTAAANLFAPRGFVEGSPTALVSTPTNGICDQSTTLNTCGSACACDTSVVTGTPNRGVITTPEEDVEVCVETSTCTDAGTAAGCGTVPVGANSVLIVPKDSGFTCFFIAETTLSGGFTVVGAFDSGTPALDGGVTPYQTAFTVSAPNEDATTGHVSSLAAAAGGVNIVITHTDTCEFVTTLDDGVVKRKRQMSGSITSIPVLLPVTPAAPPGVGGDPHIVGPHNQKYDFVGTPDSKGNSIFTLFSTPQYLINMQLKQAGPEGRYIDHLFFQFQNVTFNVNMRSEVHTPFGRFVDAKLRTVGGRAKASAYELVVELCDGHTFVVNQMSNYQADFINLSVDVPGCHNSFDGALGQMYKCNYKDLDFSKQAEEKFRLNDIQQFSGLFDPENKCPHPSVFAGRTPLQGATMMK